MSSTLHQRGLWSSTTCTLEYNGIKIEEQGFNKSFSQFVRFEDIPPNPFFIRVFHRGAIILSMFCGVWLLVYVIGIFTIRPLTFPPVNVLIMAVLFFLPALVLWFSRTEVRGFGVPGNGFLMPAFKPSRAAVQAFLAELQDGRSRYLREVYLDRALAVSPEEELRRLIWLKDQGVITAVELEQRRAKLFPATTAQDSLGFRHGER